MMRAPLTKTLHAQQTLYLADLVSVHLHWLTQSLWTEDFDLVFASHDRFQKLAAGIDKEMEIIRTAHSQAAAIGAEVSQWRRTKEALR